MNAFRPGVSRSAVSVFPNANWQPVMAECYNKGVSAEIAARYAVQLWNQVCVGSNRCAFGGTLLFRTKGIRS
jgi:hypothetical protein